MQNGEGLILRLIGSGKEKHPRGGRMSAIVYIFP